MSLADKVLERQKRFGLVNGNGTSLSSVEEAPSSTSIIGIHEQEVSGTTVCSMVDGETNLKSDAGKTSSPTLLLSEADEAPKKSKWEEEPMVAEGETRRSSKKKQRSSKQADGVVGDVATTGVEVFPTEARTESAASVCSMMDVAQTEVPELKKTKSKWADDEEESVVTTKKRRNRTKSQNEETTAVAPSDSQQGVTFVGEGDAALDVDVRVLDQCADETEAIDDVAAGSVAVVVELHRCRKADEYEQLNRIAEGTYGVVCKFHNLAQTIFVGILLLCRIQIELGIRETTRSWH